MPTALLACFALLCALAQTASAASIDEQIDRYFAPFCGRAQQISVPA